MKLLAIRDRIQSCQARQMDIERFDNIEDPVPECHYQASVEVDAYLLCPGCADAYRRLKWLGEILLEK